MPDFRVRDALAAVGLPPVPVEPADDAGVFAAGLPRVRSAAVFALAAPPDLAGDTPPSRIARAALAHVGRSAGLSIENLARALDITPRAVRRILARPAPEPAARALRVRLALENRVQAVRG